MDSQALKELMKESIREVLREERLALCQILLSDVSHKELLEIERKFGSPSNYNKDEFINMTDWLKNGG
jgi:hypothetical protein